jgi:hypothetical protein
MGVLSSLLAHMIGTWEPFVGSKISTFWDNRLPDAELSAIELFVLRSWGISPSIPVELMPSGGVEDDAAFEDLGFEPIEDVTDLPWDRNPAALVNTLALPYRGARVRRGYVDPYYGQVYSRDFLVECEAIYRPVKAGTGTFGHLSVPFRAVPRYFVGSYAELAFLLNRIHETLHGHLPSTDLTLYRGQTSEYTLRRSDAARVKLYGSADAIEPSLLPSATRRSTSEQTFMAFRSLVEMAVDMGEVSPPGFGDKSTWSTIKGDQLKVAFGQHYGLATQALDLTDSPLIACWFASTELRPGAGGEFQATPVADDNTCVVYVFRPGSGAGAPIDVTLSPNARPALQQGWVTPSTWGWRSNRAATRLAAAVYFPGSVRADLAADMPTTQRLFAPSDVDGLTYLAKRIGGRLPDSPITRELSRDLYGVVT